LTELLTVENAVALATLTMLEIVLGIDNVVFIAIVSDRVEEAKRKRVRFIGLLLAMLGRIALLLSISWVLSLTEPLFTLFAESDHPHGVSVKDIILIAGGMFLLAKATHEIHHLMEPTDDAHKPERGGLSVTNAIVQIIMLDLVFSIDSVVTAVGMAKEIPVMIAAVVISIIVMMVFANPVANFVRRHPAMKVLCLSFLLLIGLTLVIDGVGQHLGRGYIYAAMGFSLFVELIQMKVGAKKGKPAIDPLPK